MYVKLMIIIILLLSVACWRISGIQYVIPDFNVMFLFFWSIYRPDVAPRWFLIILGILRDVLTGMVFGVSAVTYVLLSVFIRSRSERYLKENFSAMWAEFFSIVAMALLIEWVMLSYLNDNIIDFRFAAMQGMLSIFIYPFFHYSFYNINKKMSGKFSDA